MSFSTDPKIFRIGIGAKGGAVLSPRERLFEEMTQRGELSGLRLIYRVRRSEETRRLMGVLLGNLANHVQGHWRELIYQRSPAGETASGAKVRQSSRIVNWRGDYARGIRVRGNQYAKTVTIEGVVTRFLLALERGSRALSSRHFVSTKGNRFEIYEAHHDRGTGAEMHKSGATRLEKRQALRSIAQKRRSGEEAEGSQRILEWARDRFGAGEHIEYAGRNKRPVHTGRAAKSTPNAIEKNAYRLLIHIRTKGTKPVKIFSRLKESLLPGKPLESELQEITTRWYRSLRNQGDLL